MPTDPHSVMVNTIVYFPYDMTNVITTIMDADSFFEIQAGFGQSILTGFARLGGQPVAVVGNQPPHLAGAINVDAADKATIRITAIDSLNSC